MPPAVGLIRDRRVDVAMLDAQVLGRQGSLTRFFVIFGDEGIILTDSLPALDGKPFSRRPKIGLSLALQKGFQDQMLDRGQAVGQKVFFEIVVGLLIGL